MSTGLFTVDITKERRMIGGKNSDYVDRGGDFIRVYCVGKQRRGTVCSMTSIGRAKTDLTHCLVELKGLIGTGGECLKLIQGGGGYEPASGGYLG